MSSSPTRSSSSRSRSRSRSRRRQKRYDWKKIAIRTGVLAGVVSIGAIVWSLSGANASESLSSAKSYLGKNNVNAAVIQLKNALQKNPDLSEARFLLGKSYLDSGNSAAAVSELQRALDLKYPADEVVPELARAMLKDRQGKKLIEQFASTTLSDKLAAADLKCSVASAYAATRDTAKAQETVAAALALVPDYAPAARLQAVLLAQEGRPDQALALIDKLLDRSPKDVVAWQTKGEFLLYGKHDVAGAGKAFRQALLIEPANAAARFSLTTTLLAQHDLEAASSEIEIMRKAKTNAPQTAYFEAQLAFFRNDFKRAHEITDQLVRLLPDSIEVRQLAGAVELKLGLLLEAERSLTRVLQLSPDLPTSRRLLAQTYLRLGKPANALEALGPLLAGASKDVEALSLSAEAYLQSGDLFKAEANFAKVAAVDPKDLHSRVAIALGKIRKGREAEAIADLRALAASDKGTYADLTLASLYLRKQDFDNALKAVDSIEAKRPNQAMTSYLRGRVYLVRNDVGHARSSFEKALAINPALIPAASTLASLDLADKQPERARQRFESVLKVDPKNVDAFMALAGMRAKAGASDEEVAVLIRDAIRLNPSAPAPRLLLVDSQLEHKDFKSAVATAQDAVSAMPTSAALLDALGRAQLASGDANQANSTFNKLAILDPASPTPYLRLAGIQTTQGDKDGAIQNFRKALAIRPESQIALRLYQALELAKRPGEADQFGASWIASRPKDAAFLFALGEAAIGRHDNAAAESRFRTVLAIAPDNAAALNNLAWVLATDGRKGGVDYAKKATSLVPTSAPLWDTLALALALDRRLPEAIVAQSKAVALAPSHSAFRVSLAKLHLEVGDKTKALAELDIVSKAADREEVQSRVNELTRRL